MNVVLVYKNRPQPLPPTSFPFHSSHSPLNSTPRNLWNWGNIVKQSENVCSLSCAKGC